MSERLFTKIFHPLILAATLHFLIGCTMAPIKGTTVEQEKLVDGLYEGRYSHGLNSAIVKVTISEGKIVDIEVVRHLASWKGDRANDTIPQKIIAEQSTDVDAVSGATNSSRVLMNAVQKAVEKAYR